MDADKPQGTDDGSLLTLKLVCLAQHGPLCVVLWELDQLLPIIDSWMTNLGNLDISTSIFLSLLQ